MTDQYYDEDDYDDQVVYQGLAILLAGVVDYLIENNNSSIPAVHFSKDYSSKNVKVEYNSDSDSLEFIIDDVDIYNEDIYDEEDDEEDDF